MRFETLFGFLEAAVDLVAQSFRRVPVAVDIDQYCQCGVQDSVMEIHVPEYQHTSNLKRQSKRRLGL